MIVAIISIILFFVVLFLLAKAAFAVLLILGAGFLIYKIVRKIMDK